MPKALAGTDHRRSGSRNPHLDRDRGFFAFRDSTQRLRRAQRYGYPTPLNPNVDTSPLANCYGYARSHPDTSPYGNAHIRAADSNLNPTPYGHQACPHSHPRSHQRSDPDRAAEADAETHGRPSPATTGAFPCGFLAAR